MSNYIENTGFEDYTERIFSAFYYYSLGKKLSNTFRVSLQLIAPIDEALLERAVKNTMQRYPYLLVRRKNTFRETLLVYNPEPVVVKHGSEPIELGCDASNGHMIAFSYEGDTVYIHVFHGLLDGTGVSFIIKTFLYYYCREAFDPDISAEGIRVIGDSIPPEEYTDPFPRSVPKEYKSLSKRPLFSKAFHLKNDPRVHTGEKRCWAITVDETELMRFCRTNDGSPAILVSVVLSRAIAALNPDEKKPIVAGIAFNLRPAFHAPLAHHSLTDMLPLEFSEKLKKHSFEMQNTVFRSRVMLKSDAETAVRNLKFASQLFGLMQKVPSLAVKRFLFGLAVPAQYGANTFMVSYVGKIDLGAVQQYVVSRHSDLDSTGVGIAIEMNAYGGKFHIDFMADFPEDLYVKAFCNELETLGIGYKCGEARPLFTPKCRY